MNQPNAGTGTPRRNTHADRLHARLGGFGISHDAIALALEESGKRDQVRNTVLRHRLKSLTAQIGEGGTDVGPAVGGDQGAPSAQSTGGGADRLMAIRDQIVDAKTALTLATDKMEGLADGRALSQLMDRLMEVRDQAVDAKTALATLTDRMEDKADGRALAELKDLLMEVSGQIVDARRELTHTVEKMEGHDERVLSELADALGATQNQTRQVLWVLSIGLGFIGPAVFVLLALMIWNAVGG